MRKRRLPAKLAALVLTAALAVSLVGCDLFSISGVPEKVTVKTDPVMEIPLGSRSGVFSEFLDLDAEMESLTQDMAGLSIVEFEEDGVTPLAPGTPKTLRLQQDMIDFNINDFAGDTLELGGINETIDPISFAVPEIFTQSTETFTVDTSGFPSSINLPDPGTISSIPESNGVFSIPYGGDPGLGIPAIPAPSISASGFDSLSFEAGTLTMDFEVTGGSDGLIVEIASARLKNNATSAIIVAASNTPVAAPGSLEFDLTGVTLPNDFSIEVDFNISGGEWDPPFTTEFFNLALTFPAEPFSADTAITVSQTETGTVDIPLGNADVVGADIGVGDIDLDLIQEADSIFTINATLSTIISQDTGGTPHEVVNIANEPLTVEADPDAVGEIDLAGAAIMAGDMVMDYTVDMDVTVLLSDILGSPAPESFTLETDAFIGEFTSLTLLAEGMNISEDINTPLEADLADLVENVVFTDPSIDITITNGLPVGLEVVLASDALRLASVSHTFPPGSPEHTEPFPLLPAGVSPVNTLEIAQVGDSDGDGTNDIDFSLQVNLTGFSDQGTPDDETDDTLTLTNVIAGDTYSLSGGVAATLDIASVTIASATMSDQFPAAGEDPLDFSMLGDFLPDELEFQGIEADLVLDLGGTDMTMDIMVYADYDDGSGMTTLPLVGEDADSDGNIDDANSDGIPDAPKQYTELDSIVDLSAMADLINDRASDITLHYSIDVSGATITTGSDVEQVISASVIATVPFTLTATADAEMTVDGDPIIPAAEEDLFGREPGEESEMDEFLGWVRSAGIELVMSTPDTLTAGTDILGIKFTMIDDDDGDPLTIDDPATPDIDEDAFVLEKVLIIRTGEPIPLDISLTGEQIDRMINDTAFMPVYAISLMGPDSVDLNEDGDYDDEGEYEFSGNHSLVNGFDLDISAIMNLQTDINYSVNLNEGGDE